MPEYEVELFFSNIGERNAVRMRVVDKLSKEFPGAGKEELASRYKYFVEKLSDGKRIYLRRPAYLHNGFDFVVHVEGVNFNPNGKRRSNPSHEDIITDLKIKFLENQILYNRLFQFMRGIFTCELELKDAPLDNINFKSGFPCDLILAVLKWLFIEQDIRYWNYSGREMLWNSILGINHAL